MNSIFPLIQVNVPFRMLREKYLELFLKRGINPEIGFDADALDHFDLPDYSRVAKRIADRGLTTTLHAPFIDLSPGSPDEEIYRVTRKRFEQVLRLVPVFRARTLVCHAGYDRRQYCSLREMWQARSLALWSWLGRRARDAGSRLMLENVYEDDPEDLKELFADLEEVQVGFCLDTGHQNAFGAASLEDWLNELGDYLGQVHLHDNDGSWDDHLALGRGNVDFDALFQRLRQKRVNPPVITLEPHREEDLLPSLEALRKLWPW